METVVVDYRNIDSEAICCCTSDKKCTKAKKDWMKNHFEDGLIFRKGNVNGKVFIEYIPGEDAWCPIEADGYMFINCLWVSGQYQGKGAAKELLRETIAEAKIKQKKGLVALTSPKKKPYLADKIFLEHMGFRMADTAAPYFELMYLPFYKEAEKPSFMPHAKEGKTQEDGWVLYYSNQCPFTAKYVPIAEAAAKDCGVDLTVLRLFVPRDKQGLEEVPGTIRPKECPSPFTTYALYHNGEFVTHEIQTDKKLKALFEKA